jgi:hypothetical protein
MPNLAQRGDSIHRASDVLQFEILSTNKRKQSHQRRKAFGAPSNIKRLITASEQARRSSKGCTYVYGTFGFGHDVLTGSPPARLAFLLESF